MPLAILALLFLQLAAAPAITGVVLDSSGAAIAGAVVSIEDTGRRTVTASDGTFTLAPEATAATILVTASGFSDQRLKVTPASGAPLRVVLEPRGISTTLTVSAAAERARVSTPAAVTVLDRAALEGAPALTLDEQLRSVPGFGLFRRSSSRVANPTTQGVTLRGLAASGASRATVVADGLPLADPFGGWVYRDRVPAAAIERVEVARGGASDIFGLDATGGAIRIETSSTGATLLAEGGEDGTARVSGFAGGGVKGAALRGGVEQFTTDGYVVVAPESRGPIDIPADSRHTSLFAAGGGPVGAARIELRGGYFSERRGNGTPFQSNATAGSDLLVRGSGAAFSGFWSLQGVLTWQDYDQTFSAVNAARDSERPTSTQHVDSASRALALEFVRPAGRWTMVGAASARQVDADLTEQLPPAFSGAPTVNAVQRTAAVSGQASWAVSPRTTLAAGARADTWSTRASGAGNTDAGSFVPRLSWSFRATPAIIFRASIQDAYRVPTINELYRAFRAGSVQTLANPLLTPEESRGADGSVLFTRGPAVVRATAFVTRVNDAIVNVTRSSSPALIVRQRANAGRIQATGIELESELRVRGSWGVTASGTYGSSTFDGGELDGLRVPQVPRLQLSAGLRAWGRHATAAVDLRYAGRQFDDDRNQFELRAAAITDARASWIPRRGAELFVGVENVFDVDQDVGRTPLRTIGLPRTARVGVRLHAGHF